MKDTRISYWFAGVLYAILAALWLYPLFLEPGAILFWRSAAFSDLLVSHWPNALFLNKAIRLWNQIPLWNPTILSGYPFAADPLSGLWYPPLWLAAIFPEPVTFNLLFWLHLVWAGFGMWRLAQSEGLSDYAAVVSGVVFMSAPKWIAHIGLGHIGLVSAVSWTPWLLLGVRNGLTALSFSRSTAVRTLSVNGLLLAVIFFADPRWLLPSMVLLLLYALRMLRSMNLQAGAKAAIAVRWAGVTGLFALGAAAGFASALVRFVTLSTRTMLDASVPDPFALRWDEFTGLIVFNPDQPEKFIYLGIGASFLALVGILFGRRRSWFWFAAASIGLLVSLGVHLPLIGEWLHSLPGASLLRVPPRWFFIVAMSVAYFAGSGFETLIHAPARSREYAWSMLLFFVLGGAALIISTYSARALFARTLLMIIPAAALVPLIFACRLGWLHPRTFLIAAVIIISIESSLINRLVLEVRPTPEPIFTKDGAFQSALEPYGSARVFSPSYSVDQLGAVDAGLELADGVHPLQLETYWLYMARATGFDAGRYSVTLPPFPAGDPADAWPIEFDLGALRRLNVQTIAAAYPLQVEGLALIADEQDIFVYRLDESMPRAWVESAGEGAEGWQAAVLSYWSPNRIELTAEGPGRLVLSELAYPGWQVRVDGDPAPDVVVDGLFRGVQLEDGKHRVSFVYRPAHLIIGMALTGLTWLAALYLQVRR
ncbi:MAG: YfhO family protein [Anaerolineales bacterium]|nr:YfhO family protein [Anaerolineales bacterium]